MSATVAVTGSGGFIGSAVARLMVRAIAAGEAKFADGTPVTHLLAIVRPGASLERLEELAPGPHWSIAPVDLTERDSVLALLRGRRTRAVLHLASDRRIFREFDGAAWQPWHTGPIAILFEALEGVPGARFVHTGSAWVLGAGGRLAESASLEPRAPYAHNKAREDAILPLFGHNSGVNWINLRLFNVFGRYEASTRLLPYLVRQLSRGEPAELSAGSQVRDFNDVDLIAQAYRCALAAPDSACGLIYHIGSGQATSARDFALTVAEVAGNGGLIRFGANNTADETLAALVADPARAQRMLNWRPSLSPRADIQRAARWWLERIHSTKCIGANA